MTRKLYCSQCEILAINNVPCHEQGCPNAKKYPKGNEVPPWRKRKK
jgi:hypothetical protein